MTVKKPGSTLEHDDTYFENYDNFSDKSKEILSLLLCHFRNIKLGEKKEFENGILYRHEKNTLSFEGYDYNFDLFVNKFGEINIDFFNGHKLLIFSPYDSYRILWEKKFDHIIEKGKYFNSKISYTIDYNLDGEIIKDFRRGTDINLYINHEMRANRGLGERYGMDTNKHVLNTFLYFNLKEDKLVISDKDIDRRVNFFDTSTDQEHDEIKIKDLSQTEQKVPISIKIDGTILELSIPFQDKIIIDFGNALNGKRGIEIIKELFEKIGKEKPKVKDRVKDIINV